MNRPIFTPVTLVPRWLTRETEPWQGNLEELRHVVQHDADRTLQPRAGAMARERHAKVDFPEPQSRGANAKSSSSHGVVAAVGTQAGDVHFLDASCGSHVGRHAPEFPGRGSIRAGIGAQVRLHGLASRGACNPRHQGTRDQRPRKSTGGKRRAGDEGVAVTGGGEEEERRGTGKRDEDAKKGRREHVDIRILPSTSLCVKGADTAKQGRRRGSLEALLPSPGLKEENYILEQPAEETSLTVEGVASMDPVPRGASNESYTDVVSGGILYERGDRLVYCRSDGTVGILALVGPTLSEASTTTSSGFWSGAPAGGCLGNPPGAEPGAVEAVTEAGTLSGNTKGGCVKERCTVHLPGEVFSSPVFFNDIVVVGCRDDHLYCLNVPRSAQISDL